MEKWLAEARKRIKREAKYTYSVCVEAAAEEHVELDYFIEEFIKFLSETNKKKNTPY